MRTLEGRPVNVAHTFLQGEVAIPVTGVSVTLTDPLGAEVDTATAVAGDEGSWSAKFPAQPLGVYGLSWSGTDGTDSYVDRTTVEVVGGFLFSVPDARASDDFMSDASAFPASEIEHYREVVAGEFQAITYRSFVPRVTRIDFTGDGGQEYMCLVPDASFLVSVQVAGVSADLAGWEVNRLGKVTAPTPVADGVRVTALACYGWPVVPGDVKRAAMIRCRDLMAAEDSGIPDRATTWQPQEGGTFRLATAGSGKWRTGIPEVDSTLFNYTLDTVLAVFAVG